MALPEFDDSVREGCGVVASLRESSEGHLCLVLDDVRYQIAVGVASWKSERFFTAREYGRNELEQLELSREAFAQIGENIIMRLVAQKGGRAAFSGYGDP